MASNRMPEMPSEVMSQLVQKLMDPKTRERAMVELNKNREHLPDLAPALWYSVGTMAALLQEIIRVYPLLLPDKLTTLASQRACDALLLLQSIASHRDTRTLLLNAHIPLYLYPFLDTATKTNPFQKLRFTSLGVIGALVKADDPAVISFLLRTEIIPLCLQIMESGAPLSKTVSTFIMQKVLFDERGLKYVCQTAERFFAVSNVLSKMVTAEEEGASEESLSAELLKYIVHCYLRISNNLRAREALKQCLPDSLRKNSIKNSTFQADKATQKFLRQLLNNVDSYTPPSNKPTAPPAR